MTTLTAGKSNTAEGAQETLTKLTQLHKKHLIDIKDAATVSWPEGQQQPKTKQAINLARLGALEGPLWKLLLGLLASSIIALGISGVDAQVRPVLGQPTTPASSKVMDVGRVDPAAPIEVIVVNNLSDDLGIGFSGGPKIIVEPGDKDMVRFPSKSAPFNLFIYLLGQKQSIKYNVTLTNNTITLEAVTIDGVGLGDKSLNVDLEGNVYIF